MGIKKIEQESGCFAKAAEDEPVFVLRSRDAFAVHLVRQWAELAGNVLGENHPKVREAKLCADLMWFYAQEHGGPKLPD